MAASARVIPSRYVVDASLLLPGRVAGALPVRPFRQPAVVFRRDVGCLLLTDVKARAIVPLGRVRVDAILLQIIVSLPLPCSLLPP